MSIEAYQPAGAVETLADRLAWAKALATANMLPGMFRQQPGNVLLAQEYAASLGIPVGQVLAGSIPVIDGRPSMSAGLMQALVRRAGHRIRATGDDQSATCEIVRRDDPDFPYRATFTMSDARRAGVLGKDNWSKYPRAMLINRAISECCKVACADVLAGIAYTPDELGSVDLDGSVTALDRPVTAERGTPGGNAPQAGIVDEAADPTDIKLARQSGSGPNAPRSAAASPEGEDYTARGKAARQQIEIDEWTQALNNAITRIDLAAISGLGNRAAASDWPDSAGMVKTARDAYRRTVERIKPLPDAPADDATELDAELDADADGAE